MSRIPQDSYRPKTRFGKWMQSRLPVLGLLHATFTIPTPKNLNWWWIWGVVLAFCLLMQIATGIALAMHYTPDARLAFASVQHIMRDVNGGYFLRYLHANGASLFFLAIYMHIFRSLYYGSYKAPREVTWLIGMVIFVLMMATAFMGYVLPWGQMSFWGATVITGLFGAIPGIGPSLEQWVLGGPALSNAALNRFFALHYLLPFVVLALVGLHVWAVHTTGNNNPTGIEIRRGSREEAQKDSLPFWPYFVLKDLFALSLVLMVFFAVVAFMPDYLGHPANYIEANDVVTPPEIAPEWYFLPFYAILRAFTADVWLVRVAHWLSMGGINAKLCGAMAMAGAILVMFFVPWLDRSRTRSGAYRPVFKWFFWLLVAAFIGLCWAGAQGSERVLLGWLDGHPVIMATLSPEDFSRCIGLSAQKFALIATSYWFAYFLVILPLLGRFEKAKPLPASIEEDFDARYGPDSAGRGL